MLNKDRFFLNFSQKIKCKSILKVLNPVKQQKRWLSTATFYVASLEAIQFFYFYLNARYFYDIYSSDDNVTWYI